MPRHYWTHIITALREMAKGSILLGMEQTPYKICPNCQQPAALTVPACLRCGRQYKTQFAPPSQQTQVITPHLGRAAPRLKPAVKIPKMILLAVGLIIGLFAIFCIADTMLDLGGGQAEAYSVAEQKIRENLLYPPSGEFSMLAAKIKKTGSKTYAISSYVDSQNGFGAKVRSDWFCKMSYAGKHKWTFQALSLGGNWIIRDTSNVSKWPHIEEDAQEVSQRISVGIPSEQVENILGAASSVDMVSAANPETWNYFTAKNTKVVVTFQYGRVSSVTIAPLSPADYEIIRMMQTGIG